MKDSETIYMLARDYVATYENYKNMDKWLSEHTNEEAKPLEPRIRQIISETNVALNRLLDACRLEA